MIIIRCTRLEDYLIKDIILAQLNGIVQHVVFVSLLAEYKDTARGM